MIVREVRSHQGHAVEPLTVKRSEIRPVPKNPPLFLPNPEVDVWRVDGLRDFEHQSDALNWIEAGNADAELAEHEGVVVDG